MSAYSSISQDREMIKNFCNKYWRAEKVPFIQVILA